MDCKNKLPNGTLVSFFELSETESDALHGFIPMTQELFNTFMDKCMQLGTKADPIFNKLLRDYPHFSKVYLDTFPWDEDFSEDGAENTPWDTDS